MVAIGECGLDYYRLESDSVKKQKETFEQHIALADELKKPLMLHVRNGSQKSAYTDAFEMLKTAASVKGNVHFYVGSIEEAKPLLERGCTFSFTGVITFFLSPMADNLTSALLMATVVSTVSSNRSFIVPAFINIIIAANAGGAWSPFGDITTLMVWTSGKVPTAQFLYLLIPSVVNWFTPAIIMFPFIPKERPDGSSEFIKMKPGAKRIIILGFTTIATAVSFHQFLHLPPVLGMMTGFGFLMFMGYYLQRNDRHRNVTTEGQFNIFRKVERVEFDTLLFFFGIITAVGALQYIGYLAMLSTSLYGGLGNTNANIAIGIISAVIDNIPVMYAVLQMNPQMGVDQWLLVTLTAGTGGSLLSIGSAAGVAVMGVRRDIYTFSAHLKWIPAIALGYFLSAMSWVFIAKWLY